MAILVAANAPIIMFGACSPFMQSASLYVIRPVAARALTPFLSCLSINKNNLLALSYERIILNTFVCIGSLPSEGK